MTETGEGRGAVAGGPAVEATMIRPTDRGPGHRHAGPDHGWDAPEPAGDQPGPDPDATVRRRAAEAAARAAEARAIAAAADAKAAIALAARAAAAADAAAQAAEQADAAVRAVAADEARMPYPADPTAGDPYAGDPRGAGAHAAAPYAADPYAAGSFPAGGYPADLFAAGPFPGDEHRAGGPSRHSAGVEDLGDPVADTEAMHHAVVPAPRGSGRHGGPADAEGTDLPAGGRAARRHAATADTTVLEAVPPVDGYTDDAYATGLLPADQVHGDDLDGDPTAVPAGPADEPVTELVDTTAVAPTGRRARRAAAARAAAGDAAAGDGEDEGEGHAADAPSRRADRRSARPRLFGRRRSAVLAAAAVGGLLALTGIVVATTGGGTDPAPAAVIESAPPAVPVLPDAAAQRDGDGSLSSGDPLSDRGAEFLRALRAAGVPTSRGGADEIEAAELVCGGIEDGLDDAEIAQALPAALPAVSLDQAAELVEVAKEDYCG